MKIERINENQIRCTLNTFDLTARNLNLGELAYGSEKAKGLFREMVQRASKEVGFELDDMPVMVEAIPMSNESVMLIITKIEDPEELDTRFSKFSPSDDEDDFGSGNLSPEILEGADSLLNLLTQAGILNSTEEEKAKADTDANTVPEDEPKNPAAFVRIYRFPSLDTVCEAAKQTGAVFQGNSILYKNPETSAFYLVLQGAGDDDLSFSRVCNTLSEYGSRVKGDALTAGAHYAEHYEVIVKKDALKALQNLG